MSPWTILLVSLGVAVFLEGLPWFVSPSSMRRFVQSLARFSDGALRVIGVVMMSVGLVLAYFSLH